MQNFDGQIVDRSGLRRRIPQKKNIALLVKFLLLLYSGGQNCCTPTSNSASLLGVIRAAPAQRCHMILCDIGCCCRAVASSSPLECSSAMICMMLIALCSSQQSKSVNSTTSRPISTPVVLLLVEARKNGEVLNEAASLLSYVGEETIHHGDSIRFVMFPLGKIIAQLPTQPYRTDGVVS